MNDSKKTDSEIVDLDRIVKNIKLLNLIVFINELYLLIDRDSWKISPIFLNISFSTNYIYVCFRWPCAHDLLVFTKKLSRLISTKNNGPTLGPSTSNKKYNT